jgi:hypothetical protein
VLGLALVAACGGATRGAPPASAPAADPFVADLELICDAPRRAETPGAATPAQRAAAISAFVDAHVRTPAGRALLAAAPEELPARLRAAVDRAGLARCPLLELLGAADAVEELPRPPAPASRPAPAEITAAMIQRAVGAALPAVQACYERELLDHRALAVETTVRFVIAPDGSTGAIELEPTLAVARLDRCIRAVIARLAFPPPRDGQPVPVEYPLRLQPAG